VGSSAENVFPEHKLRCGPARHEPGGGGINVSRAIRNLGGESTALHFRGGPTGDILGGLLEGEGVGQAAVPIRGRTRQCVTISETSTGQQYRFVMPGPEFEEDEWRGALERVTAMDPLPPLVVASGSLPPGVPEDFYGRLAREVTARGARLILDTSGPPLSAAVECGGLFLIKPSLRELRAFAGGGLSHEGEQEKAAMEIIGRGACEALVVSLGAAGALFATRAGCERLRSPSVAVRSKVGAGDSMVAGVTLALARGEALREAVRFGIAAGAAAVMTPGTELCRRDDAERLYQQLA
jgi:6-phosphofructokinase 2